jgi:hypothetical protein
MKSIACISAMMLMCVGGVTMAAGQSAGRTDVYTVHFSAAAPGKAAELGDFYKAPDKNLPMPTHFVALRHQDGAEWDYVVITHMGTKATIDANGNPAPPNARDAMAWHTDSFVAGPSWAEFTRALGIDQDPSKTTNAVYTVSVYRAVPGHRDQLEKALQAASQGSAGAVMLQHLEGGPWQYVQIVRYNSWQDFGTSEAESVGQMRKGSGPWFDLRQHVSFHTDTLTDRIAP